MAKVRRGPSQMITDNEWARYKTIVSSFITNDAGLQDIIWERTVNPINEYQEDLGTKRVDIHIRGLMNYNYFRSWPLSNPTTSGEVDKENCSLIISKRYLRDNGWLTPDGYMDFDPVRDRFVFEGKRYKPFGDTAVSQAKDEPLIQMIILKREEESSHDIIS